jgi:hypothetical protein
MVYDPRPYDESYAYSLSADGAEINYRRKREVCRVLRSGHFLNSEEALGRVLWQRFARARLDDNFTPIPAER